MKKIFFVILYFHDIKVKQDVEKYPFQNIGEFSDDSSEILKETMDNTQEDSDSESESDVESK